jgi:hypothetical protein
MGRVVVVDRADDGELLGVTGQEGKMLAEGDAGGGGGDRAELAPDLGRRVGLGVE